MRAAVSKSYGPPAVLHVEEVGRPQTSDNEVRIHFHSAALTRADCEIRDGNRKNGKIAEALSRVVSKMTRMPLPKA